MRTPKSTADMWPTAKGLIVADVPMMKKTLKSDEPTTLPMAMSGFFFTAATIEVASSGSDVPAATMVSPMTAHSKRFGYVGRSIDEPTPSENQSGKPSDDGQGGKPRLHFLHVCLPAGTLCGIAGNRECVAHEDEEEGEQHQSVGAADDVFRRSVHKHVGRAEPKHK